MHVRRRVGSLPVVSSDARIVLTAMVGVGSRQRQRSSILVTGVSCSAHSIRIGKDPASQVRIGHMLAFRHSFWNILEVVPFLSIQEGFGKRVVLDFESCYLLVLIGSHSYELGFREGAVHHHSMGISNTHYVNLPTSVELIGQLHFAEGDGCLHPMGTEVGGVWVDVDTAVAGDLWLACRHPFSIDILPAMTVRWDKVQKE